MIVKNVLDRFKDINYDDLFKVEIHDIDGSVAYFSLDLEEIYSEYKFDEIEQWKVKKYSGSEYYTIIIKLECDK